MRPGCTSRHGQRQRFRRLLLGAAALWRRGGQRLRSIRGRRGAAGLVQRQERVSGSVAGVGGAHEHPGRDRLSGTKRGQGMALLPGHGGARV